ncbi:2-dehydropantoate 2-reductase [Listeria booriae]|uniref:2-dehydropantoate 2-reductase n=1 Tax=Listeria booriae TaxID=1552123 RepID=UPI001628C2A7|nr:2-dehydropantoate 2-reductase [Listeria booriae]MBC2179319.1 2-dehydropantoate 2-reductase [Listeria booriae]
MAYRIGVVGAGALGLLYAGVLGAKVYTRTVEQAELIGVRGGVTVVRDGRETRVAVQAVPVQQADFEGLDLVVFTVKSYQLPDLAEVIREIPMQTPLLFLQNGIGHLEWLESLGHETILVGTCEHGAGKLDGASVEWRGVGRTNWAVFRGNLEAGLRDFLMGQTGFPFVEKSDFEAMLYDKLLINAVVNPLTAVLGVRNGALIHNAFFYEVFEKFGREVADVLMRDEQWLERLTAVCEATAMNYSSMATDVMEKRRTEIDSILGAVIRLAKQQGKDALISEILYAQVKGLEGEYLQ